jgi:hypothetical protein
MKLHQFFEPFDLNPFFETICIHFLRQFTDLHPFFEPLQVCSGQRFSASFLCRTYTRAFCQVASSRQRWPLFILADTVIGQSYRVPLTRIWISPDSTFELCFCAGWIQERSVRLFATVFGNWPKTFSSSVLWSPDSFTKLSNRVVRVGVSSRSSLRDRHSRLSSDTGYRYKSA